MASIRERTHSSPLIYLHPFFWARSSLEGAIGKSPLRFAQPLLPKSFEYVRGKGVLVLLVRGSVLGQHSHAALGSVRSYLVPSESLRDEPVRERRPCRLKGRSGFGHCSEFARCKTRVGNALRVYVHESDAWEKIERVVSARSCSGALSLRAACRRGHERTGGIMSHS